MSTFLDFLGGVSSSLQFSKDGGLLKWITDHFEFKNNADDSLANIKVAIATDAEHAVQYQQLKDLVLESRKGTVNVLIYCLNKDGASIVNATNGMLKAGTVIEKIIVEVGESFNGTIPADSNIHINDDDGTVIIPFVAKMLGDKAVDVVQEYNTPYIFADDLDLAFNIDLTSGSTKGYALVYIQYVDPVLYEILPGGTLIFIPTRKIMHINFDGVNGDTATIIVGTKPVTIGYVDGNFTFDINNEYGLKHTFTTEGEEYSFVIDEKEYIIVNTKMEVI